MKEHTLTLRPDEQMIASIREDVIAHIPWMVFFFLWIIIPFFFLFPLFRLGTMGGGIFLVFIGSGIFVAGRYVFCWRRTRCVITDQRLIDLEQRGFFDAIRSEVSYAEIVEVTCHVKGIAATAFRYGTLRLQTTGQGTDIELRPVRDPIRFHDLIQELREETLPSSVSPVS